MGSYSQPTAKSSPDGGLRPPLPFISETPVCVALVAYIIMSVVKAALGSVHGVEFVEKNVSGYYVANEIEGVYQGMMIVIGRGHWVVFRDMAIGDLIRLLRKLAGNVKLRKYQKHPRGP